MNKAFFTLPIAPLFLMGPASANQLDLSQVADDANWVMHVDFDASWSSKIGSFIMDKIEDNEEAVERIEEMKTQDDASETQPMPEESNSDTDA